MNFSSMSFFCRRLGHKTSFFLFIGVFIETSGFYQHYPFGAWVQNGLATPKES
jgi:hypothetical protein